MSASSTRCLIAISKPLVSLQFASPRKQKQKTHYINYQRLLPEKNHGTESTVHLVILYFATFPFLLPLSAATDILFTRTRRSWQQSEFPFEKDCHRKWRNNPVNKSEGPELTQKELGTFYSVLPERAGPLRSQHGNSMLMKQINVAENKLVQVSHFSTSKGHKLQQFQYHNVLVSPHTHFLYNDHFWLKLWAISKAWSSQGEIIVTKRAQKDAILLV